MLGYICDQFVLLERIGTSKNQGRSSGTLKVFPRCNRSIELNIHHKLKSSPYKIYIIENKLPACGSQWLKNW